MRQQVVEKMLATLSFVLAIIGLTWLPAAIAAVALAFSVMWRKHTTQSCVDFILSILSIVHPAFSVTALIVAWIELALAFSE